MLRDKESGEYWSLSWAPTIERAYADYECRHGQGYTSIKTRYSDIEAEITYFVPKDVMGEVWKVKVKNTGNKDRTLEVYSFIELLMGNALNDIINQPNDKHFTDIRFNAKTGALEATRRYWVLNKKVSVAQPNLAWGYVLYFTQTLPVKGFDSSLDSFIGRWRSEANPKSVEQGRMKNTEITAGDPVAALQSDLSLQAGEEKEFAVLLVAHEKESRDPYGEMKWKELTSLDVLGARLNSVKEHWAQYLSHVKVETPDESFNTMIGVWNQYQAAMTFDMARNSGYYHGGLLFGTGMRDQFQDILGVVIAEPQRVRNRLLNALRFQFENGSTLHNFFKLTDNGEKTNHSDTPLWIPYGLIEYLNETADYSILDEIVPYYESITSGTVYEHLIRAIEYALSQLTERGLPKIWNGDWNDTLDKIGPQGKGETVWGAFFLAGMMKKMFELLELRGDTSTLDQFKAAYAALGKSVNSHCWDGEWYIRAFKDNGDPVGVSSAKQGKIFINSQTWSVISGLATPERAEKSLASLKKLLVRPRGVQICWPSFTEVEEDMGLISRCVPGKKENGAIFNHASSWAVLALLLHGDIETAYSIYRSMLPIHSSVPIDRYEVEPYVFAEYVTSPDHPTDGQASHSWLTGTAVWMLRIGIDYILGLRTSLKGMTIDPHIPSAWKEYRIERKFRGKTLEVHVSNPGGKNRGVKSLKINGSDHPGGVIVVEDYKENVLSIEVELG